MPFDQRKTSVITAAEEKIPVVVDLAGKERTMTAFYLQMSWVIRAASHRLQVSGSIGR